MSKQYDRDYPASREQVAMEHHACVLCDETFATGNLLLDMRFRRVNGEMQPEGRLRREQVTGVGVCDTCKKDLSGLPLEDFNHVVLVECDPDKVTLMEKRWADRDRPDCVDIRHPVMRTGNVGFVARHMWDTLFNVPIPECGLCFVEPGVVEHLSQIPGSEIVDANI